MPKSASDQGDDERDLDDPIQIAVERYGNAFPGADRMSIEGHLLVVSSGSLLQQAVARFLAASGFGMTSPRYSLLRLLYLSRDKMLPQGEIARSLTVTSANVTQLIDGLERDGLVERAISAPDRRVTYARLTPEGEARCREMVPAMVDLMQDTFSMFSEEEKVQLIRLLSKFRRVLRKRSDPRTAARRESDTTS
jgi:MarR family 2-MHQ and catechol resistance regulon transcriptional repressor